MNVGRIAVMLDNTLLQSYKRSQLPVSLLYSLAFQKCKKTQTCALSLIDLTPKGCKRFSGLFLVDRHSLQVSINFFKSRAMHAWPENTGSVKNDSGIHQRKPIGFDHKGRTAQDLERSEISGDAEFLIFASGSLGHDAAFFDSLSSDRELKLPEGAVLLGETQMHQSAFGNGSFRVELYLRNLVTTQFGRSVLWSPCLPSTHTLLFQNFHAFPLGTVCVADAQLQGKGRAGNVWESPQGCLMFSFTLQTDQGHTLPFLQYVVSIAIIEAIEAVCLQKTLPTPPVKIKWPNDLYAQGLKIGGVLCTSTYSNKKFNIVVGVGLNVGNRQPTTCLDALLRDLIANSPYFQREELLAAFFGRLEVLLQIFWSEGFVPLENSYYEKWLHSGQKVILEEKREDNSVSEVSLVVQGLSPTGYLLATDNKMEKYELHPDGNSFDFLRGLVRTKLQS